MTATTVVLLLLWGTIAGLDLVSGPQGLLSRPVVVGTVAGLLTGDLEAGLRLGVLFELFALDVLPVGAARYPDYGPATVAAVVWASGADWRLALGPATLLGLILSWLGGRSMEALRHANGRRIERAEAALSAGDPRVLGLLQWSGLAADGVRAAGLTTLGLLAAAVLRAWVMLPVLLAETLGLVVIAGAAIAALSGTFRRTPHGAVRWWLGAGLLAGLGLAWVI